MLDMGFIHDVKKIVSLIPAKRQTMFFSATMPDTVEELAMSLLTNPQSVKVDPVTSTVDKISQTMYFVEHDNKKLTHQKIPVASCPWSVENMQPMPKPPKQPRPPRRDRAPKQSAAQPKKPAPPQKKHPKAPGKRIIGR